MSTGTEGFMPAFYAAVQAVEDGKAAEIDVDCEFENEQGCTTLHATIRRESWVPTLMGSDDG